jgi:hypothetical protein
MVELGRLGSDAGQRKLSFGLGEPNVGPLGPERRKASLPVIFPLTSCRSFVSMLRRTQLWRLRACQALADEGGR